MTRLYLDTEFDGFNGVLLSMALVSPEGHEWYEVINRKVILNPWVREHVVPKFGKAAISEEAFKVLLHRFLIDFANPELICDWHADAVHFCESLSGFDYGSSLDYPCTIRILKTPPGQPIPVQPHNALSDAKALMIWNEAG